MDKKYNSDEFGSLDPSLNFYQPFFNLGLFSPLDPFGGPPISLGGHWRYTSVEVVGTGSISGGWVWTSANATLLNPVVLDLDGDGIELTDARQSPGFDFFQTGHAKTTGWFTGGDGLLVFDSNGNGRVDNGSEISFLHHSPAASTDLQALAAFDSNYNGRLDPGDALYYAFQIWRDADFDGVGDVGEMQTLGAMGIQSISLQGAGGGYLVNGNQVHGVSTFTRTDGSTGSAYDVGFEAFSRGSRLVSQDGAWAVLEVETKELVSIAQPGTEPLIITDLASYYANGVRPTGFQLGDGNDQLYTASWGSDRAFYIDAGGGHDTIYLSTSTHGSVIKGGAGDDVIRATTGSDFVSPGTGNNLVVDLNGDDYHILSTNSHTRISDGAGFDVVMATDFRFDQIRIGSDPNNFNTLLVSSLDGTFSVTFEQMRSHYDYRIEYLVLKDRTLVADELLSIASANSGGTSPGGLGGAGTGGDGGGAGQQIFPILFDLDGDGFEMISPKDSETFFDWDGDGDKERTGWVGSDDALLVFDRDGDGDITRADEIAFGAIGKAKDPFVSDLEGLRLFDTNGNGALDSRDFEFARFGRWTDRDSDAEVDAGELMWLGDAGVESLSLRGSPTGADIKSKDNVVYATTETTLSDGSIIATADVILAFRKGPGADGGGGGAIPLDYLLAATRSSDAILHAVDAIL